MDVDQFYQNSHYKINRMHLSITGIWPFDTKIKRYVIHIVLILLLGSGFIFQIMGTIDVWQDPFELADSLTMICLVLTTVSKRICALYMVPKIKLMLIKMQEYNISPKSSKEYEIYKSQTTYGQKLVIYYFCFVFGSVFVYFIMVYVTRIIYIKSNKNDTSLNEAQVGIIYRVNYMVDFSTYYSLIYIHTSLCIGIHVLMTNALDCLSITMVEHCRGLFAVLSYRLENSLSKNDYDRSAKTFRRDDESYLNIIYSFQKHGETIKLIDMINSIYSPALLLQMGLTTIVLGILEYQVATSTEKVRILQQIGFLNGLLWNLFFENWRGQKIIDSSEKVFNAAYNAEWYNMSVTCRKFLLLIMMKSIKPLVLTAGKFMVLSYVTYNTLIRTSSSYYMLLRSM